MGTQLYINIGRELHRQKQRIADLERENTKLRAALKGMRNVVNEQAEDDSLWFRATSAPESYLQDALRRLHEVVEGKTSKECAVEALTDLRRALSAPGSCGAPAGQAEQGGPDKTGGVTDGVR